jgi:hypothetical protein
MPYRLVYAGLALLALAAVLLGVAFGRGTAPDPLPEQIESISPRPGEAVPRQVMLEVDLQPGYVATIYVDGFPIPPGEIILIEATGVHRWQPSPGGVVVQEWTQGTHTIHITWDTVAGLPDPGEYEWSFRVQ